MINSLTTKAVFANAFGKYGKCFWVLKQLFSLHLVFFGKNLALFENQTRFCYICSGKKIT